ncbi:DNA-binding protein [Kribbella sp. NPDC059898]|uniref:DNA-binding protein n=1 Tax=Kribbella sp. NPDC059898 TaxID=3346995 RepID=UPI00364DA3D6
MTSPSDGELLGAAEIRAILGLTRQRVYQITSRPDFPKPRAELAMGNVWDGLPVREYLRAHGYQLLDER